MDTNSETLFAVRRAEHHIRLRDSQRLHDAEQAFKDQKAATRRWRMVNEFERRNNFRTAPVETTLSDPRTEPTGIAGYVVALASWVSMMTSRGSHGPAR
jgi:hypothetical protein